MARYMDADEMIDSVCGMCDGICELFDTEKCRNCRRDGRCEWRKCLDDVQTIDAVEVVRCKDCKHRRIGEFGARRCAVWQTYNGFGDDGFCHYGERKENAEC